MARDPERDDAEAPPPETTPRGRRLVRFGLVVVTAVVLIDAVAGDKGVFVLRRARAEERALDAAVQALRLENQRLLEQTRRYREDPATIEELARRDLGMIKPGEKLFIIRDLPAPPPR